MVQTEVTVNVEFKAAFAKFTVVDNTVSIVMSNV